VILQHEFGVYGGRDGEDVLRLLAQLRVPTIVVLHTVLANPAPHQRTVLEAVVAAADAVVTMTLAAHNRLDAGYAVDMSKVSIIAHGAPAFRPPAARALRPRFSDGTPIVLTWGLLGPGKGIEWGIEAMALLSDVQPAPHYVIAGKTHPKVVAREGEAYREGLSARMRGLGVATSVRFDAQYRDAAALTELVDSADVVLLPYDSTDQVTSGVLIEAVAAGKPVVATEFPHAVELLSGGAGIVVPHRDPVAIAAALHRILTRRDVAASMAAKAAATTAQVHWPAIAAQYRQLVGRVISEGIAA
jgi:glycosyltransferase involved in cell wall biosynthesis